MRFTKIKYNGEKVHLEWETMRTHVRQDGPKVEVTEHKLVSADAPEREFVEALEAFRPIVRELLELPPSYDAGLSVQGVSLSYTEEDRMGCVITCLKELMATDSPLVLNTPRLLEEDLDSPEPGMPEEMEEAIARLCAAARRYVNGYRAQGDLFAGGEVEQAQEPELVGAGEA